MTQEEYGNIIWACKDVVRETHLDLKLLNTMNDKKKGFHRYIRSKRETRKNTDSPLSGTGGRGAKDVAMSKILNALFSLVFADRICIQESQTQKKD